MFKIVLMSFCLISTCLFASENSSNENPSQRGRYQFKLNNDGFYANIYLLDTETGRMWVTHKPFYNLWTNIHSLILASMILKSTSFSLFLVDVSPQA